MQVDRAKTEELPHTGVGVESERVLSPLFITGSNYGTRSSTILLLDYDNRVTFIERFFHPDQAGWNDVSYQFLISYLETRNIYE